MVKFETVIALMLIISCTMKVKR